MTKKLFLSVVLAAATLIVYGQTGNRAHAVGSVVNAPAQSAEHKVISDNFVVKKNENYYKLVVKIEIPHSPELERFLANKLFSGDFNTVEEAYKNYLTNFDKIYIYGEHKATSPRNIRFTAKIDDVHLGKYYSYSVETRNYDGGVLFESFCWDIEKKKPLSISDILSEESLQRFKMQDYASVTDFVIKSGVLTLFTGLPSDLNGRPKADFQIGSKPQFLTEYARELLDLKLPEITENVAQHNISVNTNESEEKISIKNDYGVSVIIDEGKIFTYPVSIGGMEQCNLIGQRAGEYELITGVNSKGEKDSIWTASMSNSELAFHAAPLLRPGVSERLTDVWMKGFDVWLWITLLDIDVPQNYLLFQQTLSKLLFKCNDKGLALAGKKFANKFLGKRIGKISADRVTVCGHALSYSPEKFYSYAYGYLYSQSKRPISSSGKVSVVEPVPVGEPKFRNIIFNLQTQKLMTLADVLTIEEIKRIGLKKKAKVDLAMDNYFLYVGLDGQKWTYGLDQENWNRFTPALQSLIGTYEGLPAKIDPANFVMENYEGLQPTKIENKVVKDLSHVWNEDSLKAYLKTKITLPTEMEKAKAYGLMLVIEKDGRVSNVISEAPQDSKDSLFLQLANALENMPAWNPLTLKGFGAQRTLKCYGIRFVPSHKMIGLSGNGDYRVFEVVEQQPAFPGNLNQFLRDNIHYPTVAQENGIQGRVIVQFVVETNGSITDVRVVRSVDPSLDKEAVRVVKSMPKWKPGRQKGEPVRVRYTLPMNFKLDSPAKKAEGVQTRIGH